MTEHLVVSRAEWLEARKQLLAEEKEFTQQRDALSARRRALPWVAVEKAYHFEGPEGPASLGDLFGGKSQLVVYHFMFGPDWEKPCKSCSFWADGYNGMGAHLAARDTRLVAISRAPLAKLQDRAKRMGWTFPWYSSGEDDFNYDFGVSFRPEESGDGIGVIQLSNAGDTNERSARLQRVRSRRRGYLPYLFLFLARARHDEPRLSDSRSYRSGPTGGRSPESHELGEAA